MRLLSVLISYQIQDQIIIRTGSQFPHAPKEIPKWNPNHARFCGCAKLKEQQLIRIDFNDHKVEVL